MHGRYSIGNERAMYFVLTISAMIDSTLNHRTVPEVSSLAMKNHSLQYFPARFSVGCIELEVKSIRSWSRAFADSQPLLEFS